MGMSLSTRQVQILRALWDGLSVKEIAGRLGLRPMTVSQHLSEARRAYGVRSTVLLIRACVKVGILIP